MRGIGRFFNRPRDSLVKTWPATVTIVFRIGTEERCATVGANVHPVIFVVQKRSTKRCLGGFIKKHRLLFFRERGVQIWYPPGSVNFQLGVTTDPGSEDGNTPATFVFADSGITVGFDFALNVRLQVTGTTIRAKLWRTDTPEPSAWTVEETMTADIGPVSDFIVELNRHGTPATANIAGFDSIDFDYDGKPCFPCTVNSETTSFETFDDFNRTVAPSSWGTASSGPTYSRSEERPCRERV